MSHVAAPVKRQKKGAPHGRFSHRTRAALATAAPENGDLEKARPRRSVRLPAPPHVFPSSFCSSPPSPPPCPFCFPLHPSSVPFSLKQVDGQTDGRTVRNGCARICAEEATWSSERTPVPSSHLCRCRKRREGREMRAGGKIERGWAMRGIAKKRKRVRSVTMMCRQEAHHCTPRLLAFFRLNRHEKRSTGNRKGGGRVCGLAAGDQTSSLLASALEALRPVVTWGGGAPPPAAWPEATCAILMRW